MHILRKVLIAALISLLLCGCGDAAEKKTDKTMATAKGAQQGMKTYYMGRFAIDLPEEFKVEYRSQKVRYAEVFDFKWKEKDKDKERETLWAEKIDEIKKKKIPRDKKKVIIGERNLKDIGVWAKAVEYYGDYRIGRYIYWTILVDYGETGVLLTLYGLTNDKTIKNFTNILNHYRYGFNDLSKDSFCLNYGRIDLPYMEQEEVYARFAGPMGMKLRIETNEIHKVEKAGLLESFSASLAANLAPNVQVDKIRARKRIIAGLQGEELVTSMTEDGNTELYFAWKYQGKEDSGDHPVVRITIQECPDGSVNEKLKLWDAALESFRPAIRR